MNATKYQPPPPGGTADPYTPQSSVDNSEGDAHCEVDSTAKSNSLLLVWSGERAQHTDDIPPGQAY